MLYQEKEIVLAVLLAKASEKSAGQIANCLHWLSHWSFCARDYHKKLLEGRIEQGGGSYPWKWVPYKQADYSEDASRMEKLCQSVLDECASGFKASVSDNGITVNSGDTTIHLWP